MSSSAPEPGARSADSVHQQPSDLQQSASLGDGVDELPLVDLAVLAELEEDLGSPDIAWNFARDYILIWRRRQLALSAALERRERSAALDAVISVRISAAMIGGMRLAYLAGTLHALIQAGDMEGGEELLATVDDYGSATVKELERSYVLKARTP
ncbi:Hpt domain-containing protein [Arthrobacter sp. NPDC058288]|uniref:Hpt domain-containing protein n=1 Tax=Arthrobacter sp. NPDC058288 TaxID=3346424 RepID=UPI0036E3FE9F